mgnify:CR=1 FL=1
MNDTLNTMELPEGHPVSVYYQEKEIINSLLGELLAVDARPLDYTTRPGSHMGVFYREELLKIKEKLDAAGVPTRKVATSRQQLREYMKEYESKNIERHHAGWPGREDKHRIWK